MFQNFVSYNSACPRDFCFGCNSGIFDAHPFGAQSLPRIALVVLHLHGVIQCALWCPNLDDVHLWTLSLLRSPETHFRQYTKSVISKIFPFEFYFEFNNTLRFSPCSQLPFEINRDCRSGKKKLYCARDEITLFFNRWELWPCVFWSSYWSVCISHRHCSVWWPWRTELKLRLVLGWKLGN